MPRSLEGLFVYEERSTSPPANDTIVVEQWTVIEVCSRSVWVCLCESSGGGYSQTLYLVKAQISGEKHTKSQNFYQLT